MIRMIIAVLLALFVHAGTATAQQSRPLRVLLDWFVNPDHGPLVVADAQGYFREAGLAVELIAPADPADPPRLVAANRADIGIGYQPQLVVAAADDLPLMRIGTLVATPLNALVVLADGPVRNIADLRGRRVGFSVGGFEDAILKAMLERHGLALRDVTLINVNFALSQSLLAGRVDAVIGAFRNFELNQLDIEGRPGRAFYPEEHGVPAYDELIVMVNRARAREPQWRPFIDAVERAVHFIANNQEEGWRLFIQRYPNLNDELNRRAWRDTWPRFTHTPAALDRARYARVAEFMRVQGLIRRVPPLESYAIELP